VQLWSTHIFDRVHSARNPRLSGPESRNGGKTVISSQLAVAKQSGWIPADGSVNKFQATDRQLPSVQKVDCGFVTDVFRFPKGIFANREVE
jgi:hypothetical protein